MPDQSEVLRRGSKGDRVVVAQEALKILGYYNGSLDGDFGGGTESAVVKWEQEYYANGEVTPEEFAYLESVARKERERKAAIEARLAQATPVVVSLPQPIKSRDELISKFGKPWESPDEWWKKWCGAATLPKEFAHVKGLRNLRIYCNSYIVPVVEATFKEIAAKGLAKEIVSFDGCFCVRPIRGYENANPPVYSIHTWALAIDVNAATNGLGVKPALHPTVVSIFKQLGWTWGGDFKRLDGMHFQFKSEG